MLQNRNNGKLVVPLSARALAENNGKDEGVADQQNDRVDHAPEEAHEGADVAGPQVADDKIADQTALDKQLVGEAAPG